MENGTASSIEFVKVYRCGYCINNQKMIYKGAKSKLLTFPALVLLIKHREYGNILIDTGYSESIYQNGLISKLYCMLNPTTFNKEDRIDFKLKQDAIDTQDIQHIIISHLHPDHIGALHLFDQNKVYMSRKCEKAMQSKNPLRVVFNNMLTREQLTTYHFIENKEEAKDCLLSRYFEKTYDLFGDGAIIIVPIGGHAQEQIGVFITAYQLFFIADADWDSKGLDKELKVLPRLIQNDYKAYNKVRKQLIRLVQENPHIKLLASHDVIDEGYITC